MKLEDRYEMDSDGYLQLTLKRNKTYEEELSEDERVEEEE